MSENKPSLTPDWVDPEDAPEWTAETFERATYEGARSAAARRSPAVKLDLLASAMPASITGVLAMAKSKTTGTKAAKAASKTLSDGRTSKASKTAAGSALSQVEKKK